FPPSHYSYIELDIYFDTKSFLFDIEEHLWIATKKAIIRIMDSQKNIMRYLSPDGELAHTDTDLAEARIYVML
ncbi:hypothetical protein NE694_22240, partial [Phocaeicola vulgatus]|uniref:hypothetical protein n=1 Tax=Phocaeicola vulgatus TaxID=821 RepID=UPI00210881BA